MNQWKEAWCVELYAPQCLIQGESDASGTTDFGELPGLALEGRQLATLLEHLQIDMVAVAEPRYNPKTKKTEQDHKALKHQTFTLDRPMRGWLDGFDGVEITRIEAQVDGALLHVRIYSRVIKQRTPEELAKGYHQDWIDEITYTGPYLVHWAPTPEVAF